MNSAVCVFGLCGRPLEGGAVNYLLSENENKAPEVHVDLTPATIVAEKIARGVRRSTMGLR